MSSEAVMRKRRQNIKARPEIRILRKESLQYGNATIIYHVCDCVLVKPPSAARGFAALVIRGNARNFLRRLVETLYAQYSFNGLLVCTDFVIPLPSGEHWFVGIRSVRITMRLLFGSDAS